MSLQLRKKQVVFGLVSLAGVAFIATLCFLLSSDVRIGYIHILARFEADNSLASMMEDSDRNVRTAAKDALVKRGEAAVPTLTHRLSRPNANERTSAARVLGEIGPPAREAMPALKLCVKNDSDPGVRSEAILAFGLIGRSDSEVIAELIRLLGSSEETDRVGAAFACRILGTDAKQTIPALIDALRDPEPEVREEVLKAINAIAGNLGNEDAPLRDRAAEAARKAMAEMRHGETRNP